MSDVITGPGVYRQRNGHRAEVTGQSKIDGRWYGRPAEGGGGHSWKSDGSSSTKAFDIVSAWIEPPTFKVGDLVLVDCEGSPFHQHYGNVESLNDNGVVFVKFADGARGFASSALTRVTLPAPLPHGYRLKPRNVRPVEGDVALSTTVNAWRAVAPDWTRTAEESDSVYPDAAPYFFAEPIPQPAKPAVDVGERWRLLEPGERIEEGDETGTLCRGVIGWVRCGYSVGKTVREDRDEQGPQYRDRAFYRRRVPKPFRISDHGPGVYLTHDEREATVTGDGLPWWRGDVGCVKGVCWNDDGTEREATPRLALVRYLRPLPKPEQWTPTNELRWEECASNTHGAILLCTHGADRFHFLEQRWTCGDKSEWRAVEVTQ